MCRLFYTLVDTYGAKDSKEKRKITSQAAHTYLKTCAKACGFEAVDLELFKNEHGKPYLKNSEFYFNISHCGEFICIAISEYEIGVDVERIGNVKPQIIERFLKKNPSDDLENTYLWTDYESIGKYYGTGIPHQHVLGKDMAIDRFQCGDFCISLCHQADDICTTLQLIQTDGG